VFLFTRPPYLRWTAASIVIAVAIWVDLRPPTTVDQPFAVTDLSPGAVVDSGDVEIRSIPRGIFAPVSLPVTIGRPVAQGEPITVWALAGESNIPPGHRVLELPVPPGAGPGSAIDIVLLPENPDGAPAVVSGKVVGSSSVSAAGSLSAPCAFPADRAPEVAVAAAEGRVTVLLKGP
jgi:hypothetical protein